MEKVKTDEPHTTRQGTRKAKHRRKNRQAQKECHDVQKASEKNQDIDIIVQKASQTTVQKAPNKTRPEQVSAL